MYSDHIAAKHHLKTIQAFFPPSDYKQSTANKYQGHFSVSSLVKTAVREEQRSYPLSLIDL